MPALFTVCITVCISPHWRGVFHSDWQLRAPSVISVKQRLKGGTTREVASGFRCHGMILHLAVGTCLHPLLVLDGKSPLVQLFWFVSFWFFFFFGWNPKIAAGIWTMKSRFPLKSQGLDCRPVTSASSQRRPENTHQTCSDYLKRILRRATGQQGKTR